MSRTACTMISSGSSPRPGEQSRHRELHPISGKKSVAAAQTAGLAPSSISTLLVEGDNRPGLGHAIAKAVGDAGINMSFVMAQVVGRRYSAVFGFENEAGASKAATLIKRATARCQEVVPRVRGERSSSVDCGRRKSCGIVITPFWLHQHLVTRQTAR
jgi:hypothetical protein